MSDVCSSDLLAAELLHAAKELAAYGLDGIKPEDVNITLIEAGPKVLPALPERISQPVHQTLLDLGVTVLTGAAVSEVTAEGLHTKHGDFVQASRQVRAAGTKAPAFQLGTAACGERVCASGESQVGAADIK